MNARGHPPRIDAVREAALLFLRERVGRDEASIGINLPRNLINDHNELKAIYVDTITRGFSARSQ